jgi:hypothetical protein
MGAARNGLADLRRSATAAEKQVRAARSSEAATNRLVDAVVTSSREVQHQLHAISGVLDEQRALLEELRSGATNVEAELRTLRVSRTEAMMREVHDFVVTRQMTYRETLDFLADDEVSFARFGDGELRIMVDPMYRLGFQVNGPEVREALRDTLQQRHAGLLLGWPRAFWTTHNTMQWSVVWERVKALVPPETRFGNSHVSRPDCFEVLGDEALELWRRVWHGRTVTVVTGRDSRFDLVPQLFDNIAGHEVVHSTPRNAFADLDRLEREILDGPRSRSDLHLVALGPAGTVLAARLAAAGVRAIDVGHISNSYRYVYEGETYPEALPGVRRPRRARRKA